MNSYYDAEIKCMSCQAERVLVLDRELLQSNLANTYRTYQQNAEDFRQMLRKRSLCLQG